MPSLNNEKRLWAQGLLRVVGVDEVGMAALAGPVVAAACMVTPDTKLIRKVNDSKVLTRLQREGLFDSIRGRVVTRSANAHGSPIGTARSIRNC